MAMLQKIIETSKKWLIENEAINIRVLVEFRLDRSQI